VPRFGDRRRSRVGLFGGSFNPAHAGHRHVAELARRRLDLEQVWLVVSPGNPLKPQRGMAPLARRLESARGVADGRRIVATAIEQRLGTRFTIDTLRLLRRRFPRVDFVWIAGADILDQLPRWRGWREIVRQVPFAVVPRPGYNHRALAGRAASVLRGARRPARAAAILARWAPPAWVFLAVPQHAASASAIRAGLSTAPRAASPSAASPSAASPSAVSPRAAGATPTGEARATPPRAGRAALPGAAGTPLPLAASAKLPGARRAILPGAARATSQGARP
jgi:nicotinate-nucleotide adenylyltransferase